MKVPGATGNQHKAELMISHPFSVNELYKDCVFDFDTNTLTAEALTPDCFQRGPSAKGKVITGSRRVYKIVGAG